MNCLTGDLFKGFLELMALSTAHAIFASKLHTSGLFPARAQQDSMLTFASLSGVPISTDTLGTVMCWVFPLLRDSLQGVLHAGLKKGLIALFFRPLGW